MKRKGISRRITTGASGQQGGTLIDAIVGVGLLGIIGVLFLSAISTSIITTSVAEEKVNMGNLAKAEMEYIKNYTYCTDIPPSYPVADDLTIPDGYSMDVDAWTIHDGIQGIRVTVSKDGKDLVLNDYKVNR